MVLGNLHRGWARRFALASGVSVMALAAAGLCAPAAMANEAEAPLAIAGSSQPDPGDPWEGFNRRMYAAHTGIDRVALAPAARGYRAATPSWMRAGVSNALRNLRAPVSFANQVLQGDVGEAGKTAAGFALNSTFGLLGLFDVATPSGIETREEDFGQTLAVWRVPEGPFLFVPALGPTTVRDFSGRLVDTALNPLTWAKGADSGLARAGVQGATAIATRESLLDSVEQIEATSIDAYVSYRSNYTLLRNSAIANGSGAVNDLPEFVDMEGAAPGPEAGIASAPEPDIAPAPEQPTTPDLQAPPSLGPNSAPYTPVKPSTTNRHRR